MASNTKTEKAKAEEVKAEKTPEPATEQEGVFIYIGPNIHGLIQTNSLYTGTLGEVKSALAGAIEKRPGILGLIVPADETLSEKRRDVKTNGTLLHKRYADLASGKS